MYCLFIYLNPFTTNHERSTKIYTISSNPPNFGQKVENRQKTSKNALFRENAEKPLFHQYFAKTLFLAYVNTS